MELVRQLSCASNRAGGKRLAPCSRFEPTWRARRFALNAMSSIIAAAIAEAPAWALVGLIMPDEQLREAGAEELGQWIA